MIIQNSLETPNNIGGFSTCFRTSADNLPFPQTKEINMQNKILINEVDNNNNEENYNKQVSENEQKNFEATPTFKPHFNHNLLEVSDYAKDNNQINHKRPAYIEAIESRPKFDNALNYSSYDKTKGFYSNKRISLDLEVVNHSDNTGIFSEIIKNYKNESSDHINIDTDQENATKMITDDSEPIKQNSSLDYNSQENILKEASEPQLNSDNKKVIFSTINIGSKANNLEAEKIGQEDTSNLKAGNTPNKFNMRKDFLNKLSILPIISPKASLNISPKSAFVFNKKLFN